ncbi:MAG: nitroreductase family protein [Saprospiraceae bacterium]|jgi:iodotyrosine deiodinase|uniref:nitroreductase family protein n=1 Tax=Candidatus Brachybacter algidus TaxID=2982024 RepID=UPI001B63490C|nr:nitroreductase family protein [Candidatus Brachybacter algidus]MBP7538342.1 nitroreductase family protein [Saprospiraceae bacterium]MBK6372146.1 nitroreductase family protein [Candidatus Brachybacter algidus]MBK6447606.1 nitroreductase family protein [Candidatus Brachybacter algidus]MBK7603443.1 nitroreductase family protein [Candidatus Brachybacter algidus]MBK8356855.1 nitroreductase family protein [Candidatus Brachybacter algidus]
MSIKYINNYPFITYSKEAYDIEEMESRSHKFLETMDSRRSVRDFSDKEIPESVIENILLTASTAPSGAHKQPWTFCVVKDPEIRKQIRIAAEKEERESYDHRMTEEWLKDLEPIGTDWNKPFLEIAPYLIVVFKRSYEIEENNHKHQNYYVTESCGIACGFLLAAIHHAGLVALTHTPSPMNFLSKILNRPINEKPFLLIPVGYPVEECWVPDIKRKGISEICNWI